MVSAVSASWNMPRLVREEEDDHEVQLGAAAWRRGSDGGVGGVGEGVLISALGRPVALPFHSDGDGRRSSHSSSSSASTDSLRPLYHHHSPVSAGRPSLEAPPPPPPPSSFLARPSQSQRSAASCHTFGGGAMDRSASLLLTYGRSPAFSTMSLPPVGFASLGAGASMSACASGAGSAAGNSMYTCLEGYGREGPHGPALSFVSQLQQSGDVPPSFEGGEDAWRRRGSSSSSASSSSSSSCVQAGSRSRSGHGYDSHDAPPTPTPISPLASIPRYFPPIEDLRQKPSHGSHAAIFGADPRSSRTTELDDAEAGADADADADTVGNEHDRWSPVSMRSDRTAASFSSTAGSLVSPLTSGAPSPTPPSGPSSKHPLELDNASTEDEQGQGQVAIRRTSSPAIAAAGRAGSPSATRAVEKTPSPLALASLSHAPRAVAEGDGGSGRSTPAPASPPSSMVTSHCLPLRKRSASALSALAKCSVAPPADDERERRRPSAPALLQHGPAESRSASSCACGRDVEVEHEHVNSADTVSADVGLELEMEMESDRQTGYSGVPAAALCSVRSVASLHETIADGPRKASIGGEGGGAAVSRPSSPAASAQDDDGDGRTTPTMTGLGLAPAFTTPSSASTGAVVLDIASAGRPELVGDTAASVVNNATSFCSGSTTTPVASPSPRDEDGPLVRAFWNEGAGGRFQGVKSANFPPPATPSLASVSSLSVLEGYAAPREVGVGPRPMSRPMSMSMSPRKRIAMSTRTAAAEVAAAAASRTTSSLSFPCATPTSRLSVDGWVGERVLPVERTLPRASLASVLQSTKAYQEGSLAMAGTPGPPSGRSSRTSWRRSGSVVGAFASPSLWASPSMSSERVPSVLAHRPHPTHHRSGSGLIGTTPGAAGGGWLPWRE